MARHGDGLYERRPGTWYLNRRWKGQRYQVLLGKHIPRSVAKEVGSVKWAEIVRGEAGIGKKPKDKDCLFDVAKDKDLQWVEANKRPRTLRTYRQCLEHLTTSFTGIRFSQITPWAVERHKKRRVEGGHVLGRIAK